MEIPINIKGEYYETNTINDWKFVWSTICEMCYNGKPPIKKIITIPGDITIDDYQNLTRTEQDHCNIYKQIKYENKEVITLDYTWKKYSKEAGLKELLIIPEFEELHAPAYLMNSLGIHSWFKYCFPNCKITYWEI